MHAEVVSERLDHACIGVILDTSLHGTPGMKKEAAGKTYAGLTKAPAGWTPRCSRRKRPRVTPTPSADMIRARGALRR